MLGKSSPNAPSKRDSKTTIQITHPTYPFKGQIFEVIPMFGGKPDSTPILIALPNGGQQLIPAEWTGRVNHPQYSPGALFPFDRLVVLRQRLDYLLAKDDGQAIITAKKQEIDRPGGSDINQQSASPLESTKPRAAVAVVAVEWLKTEE